MDRYRSSRQSVAKPRLVDLPKPAPNRHGVVLGHYSLRLHREDPVQVGPAGEPKRRAFLFCGHLELVVKLADIPLPQKGIGPLRGADPRQSELLRQAPLPGSETALRPPARLR